MSQGHRIIRGIAVNWLALATSSSVAFFLSPFVVQHLGTVVYGAWALANSLISYLALLDLGLRSAITRFVSRDHAQGKHLEVSAAVSATLWLRLWIGFGIVTVGVLLAAVTPQFFQIPVEFSVPVRWTIVVMSVSLVINLTGGVFSGVLAALQRFDLLSSVLIVQTVVRALGVLWLLRAGHGIVSLAVWELVINLLANACTVVICFRIYPRLRLQWRRPQADILRALWSFGAAMVLLHTAGQVIVYTDNLVVGVYLSIGAVTFYAIGSSLIEYLRQGVSSLTMTFTPMASHLEAQQQSEQLRRLLIQGTRAVLFVALPIETVLFLRGPTFIGLWMGTPYAQTSGRVLQILILAQLVSLANKTGTSIVYGLGQHRPVVRWAWTEAVANLGLSLVLVRWMGLEGVAWGTVIPQVIFHLLFWPRYICQLVAIPVWHYIWQGWVLPGIAVLPFALACYLVERYWLPADLWQFFLQIAALLPVFLVSMGTCFWPEIAQLFPTPRHGWARNLSAGWHLLRRQPNVPTSESRQQTQQAIPK
jgi:O-antigen/teichoic acid export membrane protein